MRKGIILAWGVGVGIITYRTVRDCHRPPMPGALLASSGAFALLALLSEPAPELAVTLAVGFDIAALMNLANIGTGCASGGPGSVTGPPSELGGTAGGGSGDRIAQ